MAFDDKAEEMKQQTKDGIADGKKNIKDAWVDTKAATEKTKNEIEAEREKL